MMRITEKDGVVEWELSGEPCNEIGVAMLEAFEAGLDQINLETTRALILHSTVRSGFCAGANLRELYEGMTGLSPIDALAGIQDYLDRIHTVMNRLDTLPFTTIGALHGVCFGGGFELALVCDVLVAETTTRFCFPELRLGIIPGFGGIPRLKRDVGNAVVRDLLLTGRSINAKKAASIGLVSQLVNRGEGLTAARGIAGQAALFDPHTTAVAKGFMKPIPTEELEREKVLFMELIQRPAVLNALQTFVESTHVRPYLPGAK